MKKIYKITKPFDNGIYIGSTKLELKERLRLHFLAKIKKQHIKLYDWLDENCEIELIEESSDYKNIENSYIRIYEKDENYICFNSRIPEENREIYIKDWYQKNKEAKCEKAKDWYRKNKERHIKKSLDRYYKKKETKN